MGVQPQSVKCGKKRELDRMAAFYFKMYFYYFKLCTCVYVSMHVCAHKYWYPQNTEEGIKFPGGDAEGSC